MIIFKTLLALLISIALPLEAMATVKVVKYPSGTPVDVCYPQDFGGTCAASGGGGGSPGGNVGDIQYKAATSTFGGVSKLNTSYINWASFPTSGFVKWNNGDTPTADLNTYTSTTGLTSTYIPKAINTSQLTDSQMYDDGTKVYINKMASTTQIANGDGTAFGNMTNGGGLAAAFDGTTAKVYSASAQGTALSTAGYIGKDWGAGATHTITKIVVYGSTNQGFDSATPLNDITIRLYGSASSPANATDGTQLYTTTFTNHKDGIPLTVTAGITTTTAYRYHWIYVATSGAEFVDLAQIQFSETVGTPDIALQNNGVTKWDILSDGTNSDRYAINDALGNRKFGIDQATGMIYMASLAASKPVLSDANKKLISGAYSGSTSTLGTTSGSLTANNCVKFDALGNLVDAGTTCGGGASSGTITAVGDITTGNAGTAAAPVTYIYFKNATSGTVQLQTVTGALGSSVVSMPAATDTLVAKATTDTLTNKRITKRVITAADATSITPNTDLADWTYQLNSQGAGTLTINADTGTPTNEQAWGLQVYCSNGTQTFSWTTGYVGGSTALPTTCTGATDNYWTFIYNTRTSKWRFTGTAGGF